MSFCFQGPDRPVVSSALIRAALPLEVLRYALVAALLVVPLIVAVAYGVVMSSATPGAAEMAIFGPAGAHLLTGHWAGVYSHASNQGGPFELLPHGIAQLLGLKSALAWTVSDAFWMFILTVGVAGAVRVVAPQAASRRPYLAAAAGAAACLLGLVPDAIDVGHPAQVMVPLMWIVAACAARDRRFALAGALVGLSMGWEVWGILGVPVILCGSRPRYRAAAGALVAAATALYLPFLLSGRFAMFSFSWPVRPGSLVHLLAPGVTTFPWTLRVVQAMLAIGGGAAVAICCRRSPDRLWLVPLSVIGLRLSVDPCLYAYYWIGPGVVLVCALAMSAAERRAWMVAGLAGYTVWMFKVSGRGLPVVASLLALTAAAAVYSARRARTAVDEGGVRHELSGRALSEVVAAA